jgi:hypothetical protein
MRMRAPHRLSTICISSFLTAGEYIYLVTVLTGLVFERPWASLIVYRLDTEKKDSGFPLMVLL